MAYSNSTPLKKMLDGGAGGALYAVPSSGAAISGGGSIFVYCSSHAATDITGTGFFTAVGANPLSSTGMLHPNVQNKHANARGVRIGDLLINVESSGGVTPGRVTWHGFNASSWGGSTATYSTTAGYDMTVAAHAST